jgi:HEAT repeat protein
MEGPVGVRLRNLEVLKREFGASEVARTACRAAMGEHAAALRLAGAAGLGDEGAKVMKAIADKTSVDLVVRVRAVADLASRCSRDVAVARLGDLLGDETREVRIATITELGRLRSRTHAVELARLAPQAQGAEAAAIATALREVADSPSLEPALLSLLSKDDVATRVAAAHALRRVGTAAAVEPLLAYTEGLTVDADLKLAAREAIAGIQSRLGPVDAGRLALADATDSGSLSLAHGTGDLSLSREAGRLSQSTDAKQRASDLDATSSRGSDLG